MIKVPMSIKPMYVDIKGERSIIDATCMYDVLNNFGKYVGGADILNVSTPYVNCFDLYAEAVAYGVEDAVKLHLEVGGLTDGYKSLGFPVIFPGDLIVSVMFEFIMDGPVISNFSVRLFKGYPK